mgnify:FL=1
MRNHNNDKMINFIKIKQLFWRILNKKQKKIIIIRKMNIIKALYNIVNTIKLITFKNDDKS